MRVSVKRAELSESGAKRANLCARRKERIKIPNYGDGVGGNGGYCISEFFTNPSAVEAILNTRALQSYQSLDSNLYRQLLSLCVHIYTHAYCHAYEFTEQLCT